MRAVVGGKRKGPAGHDGREPFRVLAEPGKALRACRATAEPEQGKSASEGAAR